jgi:hypothetical protein
MTTVRPLSADPVLAPLLRARPLPRRSGSYPAMAPKPALEARHAERLRQERVMALVFGDLLASFGFNNCTAASWFGVVETVVRGMRDRKRPITGMHLAQMPEDFANALLAETRKRIRLNDSLPMMPEHLRSQAPQNDHFNDGR